MCRRTVPQKCYQNQMVEVGAKTKCGVGKIQPKNKQETKKINGENEVTVRKQCVEDESVQSPKGAKQLKKPVGVQKKRRQKVMRETFFQRI